MKKTAIIGNVNDEDWSQTAIFGVVLMYLDPGTGSLLIQAIGAAILSVLYFTKQFWMKFLSKISRRFLRRKDRGNDQPGSS